MTAEEKAAREFREIAELKKRTMYSVPLNPSDSGMSPEQIKEHMYGGEFFLYRLLKDVREQYENLDEEIQQIKVNGIAKYDDANNIIRETYATKAETVPKELSVLEEVNPKELSILEQDNALIYIDNNGTPAKVSLNSLDYSKMTVFGSNEEDLEKVRNKDFMFTEE